MKLIQYITYIFKIHKSLKNCLINKNYTIFGKTKILNIPNITSEMGLDVFKMTKNGANPETWPKMTKNCL